MSAPNANRRPEVMAHPTDSTDGLLNPAALIRIVWELDVADLNSDARREAVRAWRERVLAVNRACCIMASPPSLDDLLWEHGNGDALTAFLARDGEPGSFHQVEIGDLLGIIVREPKS